MISMVASPDLMVTPGYETLLTDRLAVKCSCTSALSSLTVTAMTCCDVVSEPNVSGCLVIRT